LRKKVTVAFIGAGSGFCAQTINDFLLDDRLCEIDIEIRLLDVLEDALRLSENYAVETTRLMGKSLMITATTDLETALDGVDFVMTAIEVDRTFYWSMDYHIPRRYGSVQIFGENGGPGGMFHFLRNIVPMYHIAKTMEHLCPDAWLINYSNPEAKLVDAISRLTTIKAVGLCHGIGEGQHMISQLTGVPEKDLDVTACGLNHFGWYQKIRNRKTGEDIYPLLKKREREANWLASWDGYAFSRILLRTYGLLAYPVTNHIAEYISWGQDFIASDKMQYFHDPVSEDPWITGKTPQFVYLANDYAETPYFSDKDDSPEAFMKDRFSVCRDKVTPSGEYGVPIISAMTFDNKTELLTVNMTNNGKIPGLPDDMTVELPASVDATGIHPRDMDALPDPITEMIRIQGAINKLVTEAYIEQSRYKLLQAVLLDPTGPNYNSSVAMINEMCERQKEILPPLRW